MSQRKLEQPEWLRPIEVARLLDISVELLSQWETDGLLRRARDWQGQPLIHRDDVWLVYFSGFRKEKAPRQRKGKAKP